MSVHRPVLEMQSPSLSVLQPTSEIKGRLSFSSVKTPPLASKRLLYNDVTPTNFNNRLGEYHMSKQNPAILDRMYSSPSSPQKEQLYKTVSPFVNHTARLNGSGIVSRNCRSPLHASLLRQTLGRVHRNSLPGQSSLVHMAVHGSQRHYDSVGVSPVIVKLSSPDNKEPTDRGGLSRGLTTEASSWQNGERMSTAAPNPCDKTVILSALKQKRKRWATSSDDSSPTESVLPQAKRSRHSTQASSSAPPSTYSNKQLFDRKRPNVASVSHHTPAVKRTRMTDALADSLRARGPKIASRKLTVPEIEYESDGESVREGSVEPSDINSTGALSVGSGERKGSATPPVQEEEEDEDKELKKKQEQSLKLQKSLTAVFPPSLTRESSLRRKLPVFCATGAKPLLPTPLSVTHSATEEDLKRDRQAATTKIKRFLSKDDDQLPQNISSTTSSSSSASVLSVLPTASSSITSTTAPISGGFQLGIPATVGQTSGNGLALSTTTLLGGTLASTQALSVQATPLSSAICTTTTNAPLMSTGLNGLSVPLANQNSHQHGGATVSSGQLASNQSGALKSVSFSLPASTSTSLTTSQSQIQTATISTTASSQLSLGNAQFIAKGLGAPLLPNSSTATTTSNATGTTQLNPSFQFPQSTTTSAGTVNTAQLNPSFQFQQSSTTSAGTVNTAQLNPSFQFQQSSTTSAGTVNTAQLNPSFQFQQSSTTFAGTVNTAQLNPSFQFQQSSTTSSSSVPPSTTASGLAFPTNSLQLQLPSNGNPASLQRQDTSGSQQPQQQSSFSLQTGVAAQNSMFTGALNASNSGFQTTTALALPTMTTQQSLFSQNTAPLQTSSTSLFPVPSNSAGTGLSVPTLPAATTSQQTLAGFFSQKTTPLQTTSANLFAGLVTSSTTASNPTFTFNLSNNPGQQQNPQNQGAPSGLFAQLQNPLGGGGGGASSGGLLQSRTSQSQGINFNIPKTTSSNGTINFSAGTQQQQQQQQKNAVSFFGTNSQTNPPAFKFTAGVNVPSSSASQQTNTGGLFAGNPNSNGFNFAANVMQSTPSQKSGGFFTTGQPVTTTAPSGFNFSTGANFSLPKQPQQQLGSFNFTAGANLNQPSNQGNTNVLTFGGPKPTQGTGGGMFNFSANSSAQQNQTQTGTLFGGVLKSSNGMTSKQPTAPSQTQNGFNFTPSAGMGLGQINFTCGGSSSLSSNQPTGTPIFGSHQGNVAGGLGGFQTPKTSLNFGSPSLNGQQTPSNGGFNFSPGVATDSHRQLAKPRRRGRKR